MLEKWKPFLWRLIGGENSSIPTKFLHILIIAISTHFFSQVVFGIFVEAAGSLLVNIPGLMIFASVYLYLYITGNEKMSKIVILIFACALFPLSWFTNQGTVGATHLFFIFATFAYIAFTPSRYHFWVITLFMGLYWVLFSLEVANPEWVTSYATTKSHTQDIILSTFFITIAICVVFSLMMQRLEQQNKELAETVIEQKMLNETVESQYKTQKELNKALDSFVYRSSHDLRSPLTSAMGLIDITKQAKTKEEIDFYLDLQLRSLKKLDTFITDILYYSQNRHKDLMLEDIAIQPLIREALLQLQHFPSFKTIQFFNEVPENETIKADTLRMRIILNNLVSNAYKYFNPKQAQSYLKIRTYKKANLIYLIFEDNGIGIPEEHLSKIYDMFFRATVKAEGSGVGLFIVKEAVEKMGGTIHCESKIGQGTTFMIALPH